jgi:hypothetical protein
MLPAADVEVFGGFSPGLRCTVLQLLLGPDDDVTRPSDDAELDELELSAWAAKATALANTTAEMMDFFMAVFPGKRPGGVMAAQSVEIKTTQSLS